MEKTRLKRAYQPAANAVRRYFEFERNGASFCREILGGITTFITMAYIIAVNPAILRAAGIPGFAVVVLMSFTFNIAVGITAGFVLYPLLKLISGRAREVKPGLWGLCVLSLLFYVFYPYGR